MTLDNEPPRHVFGWFTRFQFAMTGVDADLMAHCPRRDVENVRTVAWLLMCVWIWQSGLFSLVGHMMMATSGEVHPEIIASAMILATIVALVDSYVIIRSSWALQGISELKRAGLTVPGTLGARLKNASFFLVRLMMSVAMSALLAIFFSIILYQKDISSDLQQKYLTQNHEVVARITSQIDDRISKLGEVQTTLRKQLATAVEQETALRRTAVDPSLDDPEVKLAVERVAKLIEAKTAAETELAEAQQFATDELAGIRRTARNTGKVGKGPVRKAAEERVANAKAKLASLTADLADADRRLSGKRAELTTGANSRMSVAGTQLTELGESRNALQQRLAAVEAEFKNLSENRENNLRTAFAADPSFIPKDEGFLGHLQGLRRIADANPDVKTVVIILDIVLFSIELAAVLAKSATFIPSTYATMLVQHDFQRAYRTAHELAAGMDEVRQPAARDDVGEVNADVLESAQSPLPEQVPVEPVLDAADLASRLRNSVGQSPAAAEEASGTEATTPNVDAPKRRGRPKGARWRPDLTAAGLRTDEPADVPDKTLVTDADGGLDHPPMI